MVLHHDVCISVFLPNPPIAILEITDGRNFATTLLLVIVRLEYNVHVTMKDLISA